MPFSNIAFSMFLPNVNAYETSSPLPIFLVVLLCSAGYISLLFNSAEVFSPTSSFERRCISKPIATYCFVTTSETNSFSIPLSSIISCFSLLSIFNISLGHNVNGLIIFLIRVAASVKIGKLC